MEVLSYGQYKEYKKPSRYSIFPYYYNRLDDKSVYGLTAQLKQEDTTYVVHEVKQGDTLDTLALYYYNSPLLFWIIADFNYIQDPYIDLTIGSLLKIPTFNAIEFNIE